MTDITLKEIIVSILTPLIADLTSDNEDKKEKAFNIALKAYNAYQDNERGGVDYIFNATDVEDCKTLAKCDITLKEYHDAVMTSEIKSDFFFCGINHPQITFCDKKQVVEQILNYIEDVVKYAIVQPYIDGYNQLFHNYISYILYEKLIVDDEK